MYLLSLSPGVPCDSLRHFPSTSGALPAHGRPVLYFPVDAAGLDPATVGDSQEKGDMRLH